jgi:hypothetical protein
MITICGRYLATQVWDTDYGHGRDYSHTDYRTANAGFDPPRTILQFTLLKLVEEDKVTYDEICSLPRRSSTHFNSKHLSY